MITYTKWPKLIYFINFMIAFGVACTYRAHVLGGVGGGRVSISIWIKAWNRVPSQAQKLKNLTLVANFCCGLLRGLVINQQFSKAKFLFVWLDFQAMVFHVFVNNQLGW